MSEIPVVSGTLDSGVTFGLVVNKPASAIDLRNIAKLIEDLATKLETGRDAGSASGDA